MSKESEITEDAILRALKKSTFHVVYDAWCRRKYGDGGFEIIYDHGWTWNEFCEEWKRVYRGD